MTEPMDVRVMSDAELATLTEGIEHAARVGRFPERREAALSLLADLHAERERRVQAVTEPFRAPADPPPVCWYCQAPMSAPAGRDATASGPGKPCPQAASHAAHLARLSDYLKEHRLMAAVHAITLGPGRDYALRLPLRQNSPIRVVGGRHITASASPDGRTHVEPQ